MSVFIHSFICLLCWIVSRLLDIILTYVINDKVFLSFIYVNFVESFLACFYLFMFLSLFFVYTLIFKKTCFSLLFIYLFMLVVLDSFLLFYLFGYWVGCLFLCFYALFYFENDNIKNVFTFCDTCLIFYLFLMDRVL